MLFVFAEFAAFKIRFWYVSSRWVESYVDVYDRIQQGTQLQSLVPKKYCVGFKFDRCDSNYLCSSSKFKFCDKMSCSIRIFSKKKCMSSKRNRKSRNFSHREWSLYQLRSGDTELLNVCDRHPDEFGYMYKATQKECCNPFNLHTSVRCKGLRNISAEFHDQFNRLVPEVIEGRKLCTQCRKAICEKFAKGSLKADVGSEGLNIDEGKLSHYFDSNTKPLS